jgi:hypothetical protein
MHDLGEHVRVVAHSRFDVEEGVAGHDHMFVVTAACHQTRNRKNRSPPDLHYLYEARGDAYIPLRPKALATHLLTSTASTIGKM